MKWLSAILASASSLSFFKASKSVCNLSVICLNDEFTENKGYVNFDRSCFATKGQILAEDEKVILRALANEFHVAPIDLIGHVLEFRIEWKPMNL
ncbi:MAG: hypothetical protein NC416_00355 [Eubacterium sp.]|nr:hypothetical protein [Eubacterium sp.]